MASLVVLDLLSKIEDRPGFRSAFIGAFFPLLFEMSPGAEAMFRDPIARSRMGATLIDLVLSILRDEMPCDRRLRAIAMGHREAGVLSLHMKVARDPFMRAVAAACPELREGEVSRVGDAYDALVLRIAVLAAGPEIASPC
jgi:hypothetical protein